ncbi:response regulator [Brevibacillus migulae]|uniref:response regulator n=1 Tax=Brevibacillus migulae TaxID=1644114 RepID=UPI00106E032F|nr:response regulator [Brevibacillus migulae]
MKEQPYRVVVIEDDAMVQEINRQFIDNDPRFQVVGLASNGAEGIEMIARLQPELAVMDIFMPALDGIGTLKRLRSEENPIDVIVVSAAKDPETIQTMLRGGVIDYIIKPFKMDRMKQALDKYVQMKTRLQQERSISQKELDQFFHGPVEAEPVKKEQLPKGLNDITLQQIVQQLTQTAASFSAEEVAEKVGIARVTARRYLEYLEKIGQVKRDVSYGGVGRPTNRYVAAAHRL